MNSLLITVKGMPLVGLVPGARIKKGTSEEIAKEYPEIAETVKKLEGRLGGLIEYNDHATVYVHPYRLTLPKKFVEVLG